MNNNANMPSQAVEEVSHKGEIMNTINNTIMAYPAVPNVHVAPKVHLGLNPFFFQMRLVLERLGRMYIKERRAKLKKLFINDIIQEDLELRQVDLAYSNTQP